MVCSRFCPATQHDPVDATALQAAKGNGKGGINIVTSTPVALSNPIDIVSGSKAGGAGLGFGR
jgi:hypothetical protein